jgi:hypothetical protein
MAWQQQKTVQHTFVADTEVSLEASLPTTQIPLHGSCRFTIENRGSAHAYLVIAADVAVGGIEETAFKIPLGQTRVSPVYPWGTKASGEIAQLHGKIGADCFVTPEVRGF